MATRRLAFMKKVNLEGIAEGWTDACYAYVIPANYADFDALSKLDFSKMTQGEQIKYEMDFVAEHFVSGQVMALNDDNQAELVDMEAEDVRGSMALADKLFQAITGLGADPKDSDQAAPSEPQPADSGSSTATTSSTE